MEDYESYCKGEIYAVDLANQSLVKECLFAPCLRTVCARRNLQTAGRVSCCDTTTLA